MTACLSDWTLSGLEGHSEISPSARCEQSWRAHATGEIGVQVLRHIATFHRREKFCVPPPSGLEMPVTGRRTCLASCTPIQSALA